MVFNQPEVKTDTLLVRHNFSSCKLFALVVLIGPVIFMIVGLATISFMPVTFIIGLLLCLGFLSFIGHTTFILDGAKQHCTIITRKFVAVETLIEIPFDQLSHFDISMGLSSSRNHGTTLQYQMGVNYTSGQRQSLECGSSNFAVGERQALVKELNEFLQRFKPPGTVPSGLPSMSIAVIGTAGGGAVVAAGPAPGAMVNPAYGAAQTAQMQAAQMQAAQMQAANAHMSASMTVSGTMTGPDGRPLNPGDPGYDAALAEAQRQAMAAAGTTAAMSGAMAASMAGGMAGPGYNPAMGMSGPGGELPPGAGPGPAYGGAGPGYTPPAPSAPADREKLISDMRWQLQTTSSDAKIAKVHEYVNGPYRPFTSNEIKEFLGVTAVGKEHMVEAGVMFYSVCSDRENFKDTALFGMFHDEKEALEGRLGL